MFINNGALYFNEQHYIKFKSIILKYIDGDNVDFDIIDNKICYKFSFILKDNKQFIFYPANKDNIEKYNILNLSYDFCVNASIICNEINYLCNILKEIIDVYINKYHNFKNIKCVHFTRSKDDNIIYIGNDIAEVKLNKEKDIDKSIIICDLNNLSEKYDYLDLHSDYLSVKNYITKFNCK